MNGIPKKTKIKYTFDLTQQLFNFKNMKIDEYSFVKQTGNVYIYNGTEWILYKTGLVTNFPLVSNNKNDAPIKPFYLPISKSLDINVELFPGNYSLNVVANTNLVYRLVGQSYQKVIREGAIYEDVYMSDVINSHNVNSTTSSFYVNFETMSLI